MDRFKRVATKGEDDFYDTEKIKTESGIVFFINFKN